MNISPIELKKNKNGKDYEEGYRIVYFYNDKYSIGEYCKTIEGFMVGFAETNPIIDDDEVPQFISIDDLLNRYLNDLKEITSVALYNVNGEYIASKDREKKLI